MTSVVMFIEMNEISKVNVHTEEQNYKSGCEPSTVQTSSLVRYNLISNYSTRVSITLLLMTNLPFVIPSDICLIYIFSVETFF